MDKQVRKLVYPGDYSQVWGKDTDGQDILLLDGPDDVVNAMIVMRGLQVVEIVGIYN